MRIEIGPSHTKRAFDMSRMPRVVKWAEEHAYKHEIDAIVACGHSGLVIAGALSYATRIPVFAVRKPGEKTVAYGADNVTAVAPRGKAQNWLWLDDLISSGGTFRHAAEQVWRYGLVKTPYPAIICLYNVYDGAYIDGLHVKHQLELPHVMPEYDWKTAPERIPTFGFDE